MNCFLKVFSFKNIEQAKFTGKKFEDKIYYRHTGHPGGIKETTPLTLKEKNKTGEILKLAVKRMLPGGVLGRKQLTKLKISVKCFPCLIQLFPVLL